MEMLEEDVWCCKIVLEMRLPLIVYSFMTISMAWCTSPMNVWSFSDSCSVYYVSKRIKRRLGYAVGLVFLM